MIQKFELTMLRWKQRIYKEYKDISIYVGDFEKMLYSKYEKMAKLFRIYSNMNKHNVFISEVYINTIRSYLEIEKENFLHYKIKIDSTAISNHKRIPTLLLKDKSKNNSSENESKKV